jgi:hypothetical protein
MLDCDWSSDVCSSDLFTTPDADLDLLTGAVRRVLGVD